MAKLSKRTRLALAPRSTKQAAIPPGSPADLESGSPPAKDPAQRRFDRLIVGLTLLLVAALVAGLLGYTHIHDWAAAKARLRREAVQRVAAVKQAYLDYYAALGSAYMQLSLTPLQPFETAAGLQQEDHTMESFRQTGYHYSLTADHDLQVVIYSSGDLASVDDNLVQHTTPLDPTTLTPAGSAKNLPIHTSYALKRESGRWLVDSVVAFGADGSDPQAGLSYAAVTRGKPIDPGLRSQIGRDYLAYWEARKEAYQNLDPAPMRRAILSPALDKSLSLLAQQQQLKQGFAIRVEHNDRVALKDAATAYVYDTFADSSYVFDFTTKSPAAPQPTTTSRETFEMKNIGGVWKVDLVGVNSAK